MLTFICNVSPRFVWRYVIDFFLSIYDLPNASSDTNSNRLIRSDPCWRDIHCLSWSFKCFKDTARHSSNSYSSTSDAEPKMGK
jgi:hypothetical protein